MQKIICAKENENELCRSTLSHEKTRFFNRVSTKMQTNYCSPVNTMEGENKNLLRSNRKLRCSVGSTLVKKSWIAVQNHSTRKQIKNLSESLKHDVRFDRARCVLPRRKSPAVSSLSARVTSIDEPGWTGLCVSRRVA